MSVISDIISGFSSGIDKGLRTGSAIKEAWEKDEERAHRAKLRPFEAMTAQQQQELGALSLKMKQLEHEGGQREIGFEDSPHWNAASDNQKVLLYNATKHLLNENGKFYMRDWDNVLKAINSVPEAQVAVQQLEKSLSQYDWMKATLNQFSGQQRKLLESAAENRDPTTFGKLLQEFAKVSTKQASRNKYASVLQKDAERYLERVLISDQSLMSRPSEISPGSTVGDDIAFAQREKRPIFSVLPKDVQRDYLAIIEQASGLMTYQLDAYGQVKSPQVIIQEIINEHYSAKPNDNSSVPTPAPTQNAQTGGKPGFFKRFFTGEGDEPQPGTGAQARQPTRQPANIAKSLELSFINGPETADIRSKIPKPYRDEQGRLIDMRTAIDGNRVVMGKAVDGYITEIYIEGIIDPATGAIRTQRKDNTGRVPGSLGTPPNIGIATQAQGGM